jgi:uroporphyrinogen III methyltransferase / synthase
LSSPETAPAPSSPATGHVYLVGAGPGDPGLLTARALELIATVDVVLYDRLIPAAALDGARADAELLFVGKEGGGTSVPQEQTEELMVRRAQEGKSVVRLKGGDPFVFGRGGEEALTLRAQGISYEVVPGITAGVAAAAYAGIPVTQRGLASAVALVTGHEDPEKDETAIDWPALAAFPGTLVFYMGVRRLPRIAAALIAAGRPASEPAAVVERGTLPGQRTVAGTLETIAARTQEENVRPPSIAIVGAVTQLAEQLDWLPPRPLGGLTIAVTRARSQASDLARELQALGATVVQAPVIRTRALPGSAPDLAPYDLVCLTSANAVSALFERLTASGRDARALAGARVAAIGPGTARALAERGILADIVPARSVAESLVEALAAIPVRRALVARALQARETLPDALRARGAQVDVLALYETLAESPSAQMLQTARDADYITFTSSSTVRFFLDALRAADLSGSGTPAPEADAQIGATPGIGEPAAHVGLSPAPSLTAGEHGVARDHHRLARRTRIVSIGPITSGTLREHGLEPHVEAQSHDVGGVIQALLDDVAARAAP